MMHLRIEFDYSSESAIRKMEPHVLAQMKQHVPGLEIPDVVEERWQISYDHRQQVVTSEAAEFLSEHRVAYAVRRFIGTFVHNPEAPRAQHLHIAIPAIGLLVMDQVEVLENACTHSLQDHLNDGWRIIAVCPPDAKRRPDYIIGRSSKA